jgi:heme/copper-type cytochrome/quinol oxidase subunit 2
MHKLRNKIFSVITEYLILIALSIISFSTFAQTPTHIPRERIEPVNFFESTENIIFFIVIPVIIVILYLLWRRERRKQKKEAEQRKSDQE